MTLKVGLEFCNFFNFLVICYKKNYNILAFIAKSKVSQFK